MGPESDQAKTWSRREVLQAFGTGALAVGGSAILTACGGTSSTSSKAITSTSSAANVVKGGTLRAGLTGGGSADVLDAQQGYSNVDFARIAQLYETLFVRNANAELEPRLALSVEPNAKATEWTIRLRPDVTFHDGRPFTADDVIYSYRRILNPKKPLSGAATLARVDAAGLRKLDKLTVRVPCKTPFSIFPDTMGDTSNYMVPVGYDPSKPNGTGPFKYQSFTPGVQSTFVRNPNYWQPGVPYLDRLLITDFADETSQVNALTSGAVDIVNLLSAAASAEAQGGGAKVVYSEGGGFTPITMRVDVAPFSDVRVRQAMRLLVDRTQMRQIIFDGHGVLGNDIFGIYDPSYDHSLAQREQDLDQAKSLLKAAGRSDLTTALVTGDIAQGVLQMAQILQQQAKGAGVTIQLQQKDVSTFYGPNYLRWSFAQDYWYYNPYLEQVGLGSLPNSEDNETHFANPRYISLYNQALAATSTSLRTEIIHEMMAIDYNEGGYIIPFFSPVIDGYSSKVQGVVPSKIGVSFNYYDLRRFWLSS
jgi:peptide/nickel transport system substrate-binding protein